MLFFKMVQIFVLFSKKILFLKLFSRGHLPVFRFQVLMFWYGGYVLYVVWCLYLFCGLNFNFYSYEEWNVETKA